MRNQDHHAEEQDNGIEIDRRIGVFEGQPPYSDHCQMDTFLILEALGVCWGLQLPTAAPRATS
jgi:hypothetical protein